MKKFLKDYWVVLSYVLALVLDANYGILEHLIKDAFWLNIAKGLGGVLLAAMTKNTLQNSLTLKDEEDIGGGGIKNPKP